MEDLPNICREKDSGTALNPRFAVCRVAHGGLRRGARSNHHTALASSVEPVYRFPRAYDFSRSIVYKTQLERSTLVVHAIQRERTVYGQT